MLGVYLKTENTMTDSLALVESVMDSNDTALVTNASSMEDATLQIKFKKKINFCPIVQKLIG